MAWLLCKTTLTSKNGEILFTEGNIYYQNDTRSPWDMPSIKNDKGEYQSIIGGLVDYFTEDEEEIAEYHRSVVERIRDKEIDFKYDIY